MKTLADPTRGLSPGSRALLGHLRRFATIIGLVGDDRRVFAAVAATRSRPSTTSRTSSTRPRWR